MRKEFNFTLGADPEFNMIMQGRRLNTRSTMTSILDKNKEYTKTRDGMGYTAGKEGAIGWDGASATGEIRPAPATTADKIAENLEEIFKKFTKAAPLFDLSTLSYFGVVGGHIHFSIPTEYRTAQKIANIHKKVASLYLPILMSENRINLQIRSKIGYGRLGDHRPQFYARVCNENGNNIPDGYEFRTPSAEWLTTKKIALSTMAYAGTIYNEVINHPEKIKELNDIFFKTEKQAEALQMLAMSDYESLTLGLFKRIKKEIKNFEFYPEYKEEIDYILNTEQVIKDKQRAAYNILNGWGMREEKENPTKKDLLSTRKLNKKLESVNMDMMNSLVNITYNNDVNVETFKKAIVERTAVYNWRLKHTYFLFGNKKGLDNYIVFDNAANMYNGVDKVKTVKDKEAITTLYCKIKDKFEAAGAEIYRTGNREIQMMIAGINPEKEEMKKIFIGIPYGDRIKENVKEFIKIIYELENKIPKGTLIKDIKTEPIAVDKNGKNLINQAKGLIAEILEESENNVTYDNMTSNRNPIAELHYAVADLECNRISREPEREEIALYDDEEDEERDRDQDDEEENN